MSKNIDPRKDVLSEKQLGLHAKKVEPKSLSPEYLEASAVIRDQRNNLLDGKKIAQYFAITLRELARIIDAPKDILQKAPDSLLLQSALQPFEKITWLRILFDFDDVMVRSWLNLPNEELAPVHGKHACPMDIIKAGHPEIIAGMVNRAFTGEPS